jgi:Zn-dependent metalloprotease
MTKDPTLEFTLLHQLAREPQRVFTKDELLGQVWGYPAGTTTNSRTLDAHAARLRHRELPHEMGRALPLARDEAAYFACHAHAARRRHAVARSRALGVTSCLPPNRLEATVPHRCSIACIIPPVLLEELVRSGSDEERDAVLRTLSIDATLRTARVHNALVGTGANPTTVLQSVTPGQPARTIYDCEGQTPASQPQQVRGEGDPASEDVAVNEAYDGLGDTYGFYWDQFQRDSIDDQGMPLHGWVHYGQGYDNAFWDGQEMVFGDGKVFDRFTKSLDVIGHELTHGVTEHEAGLQYLNQSGALNESISDVFGVLVKQYTLGQTVDQADWLIGADLVTPAFPGTALRSMAAPGTAWERDDQPATMDDYVHTMSDNGGVHTNSGIPNKAFHALAMGLGGHSWDKAGPIWYEALRDPRVKANANFRVFAGRTLATARRLYGAAEVGAVADSWQSVGVAVS